VTGKYRAATGLDELISAVATGAYSPSPGSVGARLLATRGCACHGRRTLARFARAALRAEGLWWVTALEADPDSLNETEAFYVATAFRLWVDGARPFRRIGGPDVIR
jgi:hypothetical protein